MPIKLRDALLFILAIAFLIGIPAVAYYVTYEIP